MSRKTTRLRISFFLAISLGATLALAESPEERADRLEREIEQLRTMIAEIQEESGEDDRLSEIERQLGILAEEVENLKIGEEIPVATSSDPIPGLAPAAAKVYRKDQGLSIGGYGEGLLEIFDDTRDDGSASGKTNTFDLLRAIVYFGYKFTDRFVFNSEIEFEHSTTSESGSASVEFAYLDYLYRPGFNVRGGLLLVPMGFVNEVHEPTTFLGARRPETEARIIPSTWRENGVGVHGSLGGFTYRTYLLNGLDASGFSAAGLRGGRQKGSKAKIDDAAWVGRADWIGTPGLMAGFSAYFGDSGQDLTAPDGSGVDVPTRIWEAHVEWRIKGLELRGLYANSNLEDVAALNEALGLVGGASVGEEMEGAYLQAGWDLLARRQGRQSLTPYLRWERVNTQKKVPNGWEKDGAADTEIFTLGLAYQPIEQLIIKIDWQDIDNAAGSGVDQFNVAFGYIF
jgi:hypothetical protein